MPSIRSVYDNIKRVLASHDVGRLMFVRGFGADDNSDDVVLLKAGANGGLAVEGVTGGTPVSVSGTVTATVDVLDEIKALAETPSKHTAITAADATDVTALANVGVYIGGDGNLAYRTVGDSGTTVTLAVVAGQFVWGQFTRVMAATTATGIVGVAR